uniref:Uncharacterized protein n=1 Tax=Anguilla anguilla TaxID=7936 RepID=A0A0E9VAE3_ANGAN
MASIVVRLNGLFSSLCHVMLCNLPLIV